MEKNYVVETGHSDFGRLLATKLQAVFIKNTIDRFADSESSIDVGGNEDFKDSNVVVVHQFAFTSKPLGGLCAVINNQLFDLIFTIDLIKQKGAKKIVAVLPYLPYVRQEKSVCEKHLGPFVMLTKLLKVAGVDSVLACDLHSLQATSSSVIPLCDIALAAFWVDILNKYVVVRNKKDSLCVVSPDHGGRERAQLIASALGVDLIIVQKRRVATDVAIALEFDGNVQGKVALVVDDIIDTARTAISACDLLLEAGASKVLGFFSHAVLSDGACERLAQSKLESIFITDTILYDSAILHEKFKLVTVNEFLCTRAKETIEDLFLK